MADFKAHDARLGPKLGASLASGLTGLARRVELARERERAAVLARRATVEASNGLTPGEVLLMQDRHLEAIKAADAARSGGESGTGASGAEVKREGRVSPGRKSGPRGGRPRVHDGEPWKAAGVSRAQWYRDRKREEAKGDG